MCVESVVKMKTTLRALAAEPGHDMHAIIPTENEFKVLAELLSPLLMIKNTSERLSADKPSLHIVLCCLMNILTISQEADFAQKSEPFRAFVTRFEKEMLLPTRLPDYGRTIREFCLGNMLHPRFKGCLVSAKTSRTYEPLEYDRTIEYIKDICTIQVPETEDMEVDSPSFLNTAMNESDWGKMPSFVTQPTPRYQSSVRAKSPIEKELDKWFEQELTNHTDIDILAYWQENEKTFPLLSKVARRIYGIPVTSASSERMFSAAGNVISSSRTLLATERAEQLIFIHDNYWAVEPTIKKWKLRSDRERGKDRPQPRLTQEQEEQEDVDDPQPSTSSQSQSLLERHTPKSSKKARKIPRVPRFEETDSDSD
jgi:hAT family C-terminal dimerisation region